MPFTTITKPATGVATKKSLIDAVIDNLSDLNSRTSPSSRNNMISNGSFEIDADGNGAPDSWTVTDYTGGSHTISTTNNVNGTKSMAFTSTSTVNGGGYAASEDYIEVTGGETYYWFIFRVASAVNISSKAEISWYDEAQSLISTSTLNTTTSTPTSLTSVEGHVTSPATARYAKVILTGGVPGSGSATGTVYFDDIRMQPHFLVTQAMVDNAAVGQGELKTTTGTVQLTAADGVFTLPGGTYGFYPQLYASGAGITGNAYLHSVYDYPTTATTNIYLSRNSGFVTATQRYVQASPPYDLGDGVCGMFVFLLVDSNGNIIASYCADDAPWHNNGPTDIRAKYMDSQGRRFRECSRIEYEKFTNGFNPKQAMTTRQGMQQLQDYLADKTAMTLEITQQIKQRDMGLIPHPFVSPKPGQRVVLLDPVSDIAHQLSALCTCGESVSDIVHGGYLSFSSTAINRRGPPGVLVSPVGWRSG